jgi:putative DNA primase/helicase
LGINIQVISDRDSLLSNGDLQMETNGNTSEVFEFTDSANADRLVKRFGHKIRFVVELNKWVVFDDTRWVIDKFKTIYNMATETAKGIGTENGKDIIHSAEKLKHAGRSLSNHKIAATIESAKHKERVVCSISDFDKDPRILNLRNGYLDLNEGCKFLPHDKSQMLMKVSPVEYRKDEGCPNWDAFLDRIFKGNKETIRYIQKAVGYTLTGLTDEECFFILHGGGANGKSVFLETIQRLLGEYSCTTPMDTLMAKSNNSSQTNDLARMNGARLIVSSEAELGQQLAESKIKQLTGGDVVSARFLYGEYIEFRPTGKIWIALNHKPRIRGTDDGIWRRIRLVPFDVQIPEGERDPSLKGGNGKLARELPGILNWAIEGYLAWLEERLVLSDAVRKATLGYRSESDMVNTFVDECCDTSGNETIKLKDLYSSFQVWCEDSPQTIMTKRAFSNQVQDLGFETYKRGDIYVKGIGMVVDLAIAS